MSRLNDFIEKIFVKDSILDVVNNAECTDEELETAVKRYLESRDAHYEASKLPQKEKSIREDQVEKYNTKIRRQLREFAGLTSGEMSNSKMDEYKGKKIDLFFDDVKELFDEKNKSKTQSTESELSQETEKWKDLATQRKKKNDEYAEAMETFKANTEDKYKSMYEVQLAKVEYRKWVNKLIKDGKLTSGNDYTYENIENKIFEFKVDKDLNIFNSDGSKAVHPEEETALDNAKDLAMFHFKKAGVVKTNNARVVPKSFQKNLGGRTTAETQHEKAKQDRINAYAAELEGLGGIG